MKKTSIKDLPFTEAVIANIDTDGPYMTFTVVSDNYKGTEYKVTIPKNEEWLNSDAYTRNQPLAVKIIHYTGNRLGKAIDKARLEPNYTN